ncbi:MAG: T9SS type A sorting domain-containing protein, partial [Fidelibacterota bacterium]
FVIDTHAPEVISVSSTTTDGWYKASVIIPIVVNFSENVTVSGTPTLILDVVGGYTVNYTSGSGSAALIFNYTVQDSHDCADLDYQSSASLSLNGGVINDLGRNDADLSLPPPGADSSLGGTRDIILDTQAPSALAAFVYDSTGADIDSTSSIDSLSANWGGFTESVSGIALYEYAIGTTRGDTDVVSWTSNDTTAAVTAKGLQLTHKRHYYFSVRATDGAGNTSDSVASDGVRIVDKPRLTVNVVQNSVISEYVQIFVIDTLAMADSIRIYMDSLRVSVTRIIDTSFAYVGTHKYTRSGPHSLEVTGFSGWGDTTRTSSLALALAKQSQPWVAASTDQLFKTVGSPGSVSGDRYLLVVDSTLMGLSAVRGRSYRLGDGQLTFDQPVQVSMHRVLSESDLEEAQAIYILRPNGSWQELPSVYEGDLVTTWTDRAGTFRLGPRTIIVPQVTSLHQNYPNPFNPTTHIVFDLGFQDGPMQQARVVIYNLLGQEVLTLFNGEASTGRYEFIWNGVDARGIVVASGVYFVHLSTNTGHHMTRKMLLVR